MAVNNLQFKVALRENKNRKSAGYGKFYVEKARTTTLSQRGFSRRASSTLEGVVEQKTIEGKKVRQITPLDVWLAEHEAPQP